MGLIIAPIIFIAVVLYVAYPLLADEGEAREIDVTEMSEQEQLQASKQEIIANLKDIEMDYQMGKLTDEDYENLKAEFQQQAVHVLEKLERLEQRALRRKSG